MRKHYLDNIRWFTVVLVVIYHVFYMYNAEGIVGVVGKITSLDVQYYDVYQYIVYPWFMPILFMVSGISSKLYLDNHTNKEFIKSRTSKLLVPVTIGLFAFQFIQGYVNASISGVINSDELPPVGKVIGTILSGIGVLWYIQLLWIFSLLLIVVKKIEKGALLNIGRKVNFPVLIALFVPAFLMAQILNTPLIVVYRFGYYFFVFLLGYYVLSHDEVIEVLKKWSLLLLAVSVVLCIWFCIKYFGDNYADKPVNRSVLFLSYSYFMCLALIGCFAKYFDFANAFTKWMSTRSFGLYVFHYLGISAVGLYLAKPGLVSAPLAYMLSLIAGFGGGYILYEIISRIPGYRWMVLGMKKKKS
ncbi:MAG: acyltransferase [Lachnospiraceae bacterium]|jgi:peptidoglycan/LPS O-acetylase OafA/YrhL|nr:acyltransferase [Lachnospiraceae bacterium]